MVLALEPEQVPVARQLVRLAYYMYKLYIFI
jgi:hypothetical protein